MPEEYLTKMEAIEAIRRATGYGKYIIDRKMDELAASGKIVILEDPGDKRKQRISRGHVQIIIDALKLG
jgi:lipoate-protein ligase A